MSCCLREQSILLCDYQLLFLHNCLLSAFCYHLVDGAGNIVIQVQIYPPGNRLSLCFPRLQLECCYCTTHRLKLRLFSDF